jgi:hypothetical protein
MFGIVNELSPTVVVIFPIDWVHRDPFDVG